MPLHINLSHDSTRLPDSCTICYMIIVPKVLPPNKISNSLLAHKLKARNLYLLNKPCVHAYMCMCVCVCLYICIYIYYIHSYSFTCYKGGNDRLHIYNEVSNNVQVIQYVFGNAAQGKCCFNFQYFHLRLYAHVQLQPRVYKRMLM